MMVEDAIPMNLIEGSNRFNTEEYGRLVGIAKGSAGEISYQILLAKGLVYTSQGKFRDEGKI